MNPFLNINYLKTGSFTQQKVYNELMRFDSTEKLAFYQLILAGTIPIEISLVNQKNLFNKMRLDICWLNIKF